MSQSYPELNNKFSFLKEIILNEEELFLATLNKGLALFDELVLETKNKNIAQIDGKKAFTLYDTYGFPWDLIKLLAKENKLTISEREFEKALNRQKSLSGAIKSETIDVTLIADIKPTLYVGEQKAKSLGKLLAIIDGSKSVRVLNDLKHGNVFLIFDETCFYGESGGQIGDQGDIYDESNSILFQVTNTIKIEGRHLLQGKLKKGQLVVNESYFQGIDTQKRNEIKKNHSATHLLQQALINHLGEHIRQAGSLITSEKLRFDFNHYQRLSENEIESIEKEINEEIIRKTPVGATHLDYEEAIRDGARAFFEEKYQEKVRVINIGKYSKELCGGSHVSNTSEIGSFKVISESSVASGVRRIEAITGKQANVDYLEMSRVLKTLQKIFNVKGNQGLVEKLALFKKNITEAKNEQKSIKQKSYFAEIEKKKSFINGFILYSLVFEKEDSELLKSIIDTLKAKEPKAIILFINQNQGRSIYFVALGKESLKAYKASDLIAKMNQFTGGNGGGKSTFAQGGGKVIPDPLLVIAKFKTLFSNG